MLYRKPTLDFNNSINIFTDASLAKYGSSSIVCSGYAVVKNGLIIDNDYRVIDDATSNYGELYAILMGIQSAIKYKALNIPINLFSDSKISIETLRRWIFKWENIDNVFINSSGREAENQDIISFIVSVIYTNQIPVKLFAQRGHKNPFSNFDVCQQRQYFGANNNAYIDHETARSICYYNQFIDNITRMNLHNIIRDSKFNQSNYAKKMVPVSYVLSDKVMDNYANLIN